jgi:hypothetical protein
MNETDKPTEEIVFALDQKAKTSDVIKRIIYFLIGLGIAIFLCISCLFCSTCNIIVTAYLCFLSFICFCNAGIPVSGELLKMLSKISG